jgi:hypothetical protein
LASSFSTANTGCENTKTKDKVVSSVFSFIGLIVDLFDRLPQGLLEIFHLQAEV